MRLLPAVVAAALLVAPALARATPLTFHVVDQRGTTQYSWATLGSSTTATDAGGSITLDVAPGDSVSFTRQPPACPLMHAPPPPEGASGQAYAVTGSESSPVTITLPDVEEPYHPELSPAERWIIGRLNQGRAALGRPQLVISDLLDRGASAMARDEAVNHRFPDPNVCTTQIDEGWPGDPFATDWTLADAPIVNPARVLAHWDGSDPSDPESAPIWHQLSAAWYTLAGIADADGAWIIVLEGGCPVAGPTGCGVSGDTGDVNAYTPDLTPPTIHIDAPLDGAHVAQGATVLAAYGCDDGTGSGVNGCAGPVPPGAPIDTATAGTKSFTVSATDVAGNPATATVQYVVDPPPATQPQPDPTGTDQQQTGGTTTTGSGGGGTTDTGGAGGSGSGSSATSSSGTSGTSSTVQGSGSSSSLPSSSGPSTALLSARAGTLRVRRGRVVLALRCEGTRACRSSVVLYSATGHVRLGKAKVALQPDTSLAVPVVLDLRAKKLLARRKPVKALVWIRGATTPVTIVAGR